MAQVLKPTPVAQADANGRPMPTLVAQADFGRNLKPALAAKLYVFSDFLFFILSPPCVAQSRLL
jgi:hypothetical protein